MDLKILNIRELEKRKTHCEFLIEEIEEIAKNTSDIQEIKKAYREQLAEVQRLLELKIRERRLGRGKKLLEWFGIVTVIIAVSFFVYDFEIWKYFQLGLLKKIYLLAKDVVHFITKLPGSVKCLLASLGTGFLYWATFRDKIFREKKPRQAKAVLLFATMALAYDAYMTPIWLTGGEMYRLSLFAASLVVIVSGHMTGFKTLVYVGLFGLSNWLGGTTGYMQGCYWLCMNNPLIFVPFGTVLILIGHLIQKYGVPELKQPFEVMGSINLFTALLILSIWGHWFDMAGDGYWIYRSQPDIQPVWFIILMTIVCAFFIWVGIKKERRLFFNFGVTFLVIDLYTRFFESFPAWLPRSLFWGILGGSILLGGFIVKKKLLGIQRNFK